MEVSDEIEKYGKRKRIFLPRPIGQFFQNIYDVFIFIRHFFKEVFLPPYEGKEIIRQFYDVGVRTLPLITLTGFIIGIVFTKQSRPSLAQFGAASWLPSLVSIAIIRALAPLVTALIAAGKVGSNIGAELGSMKVTEQIDAMELSATNPFKYLVVSRVLATTFMLPLLSMYAGCVGLLGSYLNVHNNELTSFTSYFQSAFGSISFLDIYSSVFKACIFGFTIGVTSCFIGFNTKQGTVGVGRSANASVVASMFLIFIEEMIIVQFVNAIR